MNSIDLAKEATKVIADFGTKIQYYESWLCSCVAERHGAYDPNCGCMFGYHYKDPVEYMALRTSIDSRRMRHPLGEILQGGCLITLPLKSTGYAVMVGCKNLSSGIDLTTKKFIKISIDGASPVSIDLSSQANSVADTKIYEIVRAINSAGIGEIAYETGKDGDLSGAGYLCIRSNKVGSLAKVSIYNGDSAGALGLIFETNDPIHVRADKSRSDYLPVYHKLSRGDVIVTANFTRRAGDILRRGTRDIVNAFDIQRIESVTKKSTRYYEGVDFTISGATINWNPNKGVGVGEDYTVEFISKINYIVVEGLPIDRGDENEYIPKKAHLALRTYNNSSVLPIEGP